MPDAETGKKGDGMSRKTALTGLSTIGLVLVIVLVVAGGLLTWGSSYTQDQVREQLSAQQISFPPAGPALDPYPELQKYAGQQVVTGEQANAYAAYIQYHLDETADGKTYSQVSTLYREDPNNEELAGQRQALFMGTTLRGMLLQAYAFSTVGAVAGIAAIVSFVAAAILLALSVFGLVRARQTSEATVTEARRRTANEPLPARGR
jgi:hypothetical protein